MKRYCGRDFTEQELDKIRELIAEDANRTRAALSRLTCQALDWYKADGGLKDMSCRVAMLRMAEDGLITLPPSTNLCCGAWVWRSRMADGATGSIYWLEP